MEYIQDIFNRFSENEVNIPENIYKAPLKINRPCKIYGNGSVIICAGENAVLVESDGVELHNFRIESDSENPNKTSVLECHEDTLLEKIYVRGNVKRNNIYDAPKIPIKINLGEFKSNAENTYSFSLELCEAAHLYSDISEISISEKAESGMNTVTLKIGDISSGISVFGKIYIVSSVIREIYLSGEADKNACLRRLFPVNAEMFSESTVNTVSEDKLPPVCNDSSVVQLKRGQRISLDDKVKSVQIQFVSEKNDIPLDIDGYAFMIQDNGKVSKDDDMIFWGNKCSPDNSVKLFDDTSVHHFSVSVDNISDYVGRIAVCYSIYGDEADKIFRFVHNPYIRIFFNNVEKYNFRLSNLNYEKTIAGIEFYRYRDNWKINCIGAGYNAGLKRMCEDYGIEVID
ncbi:MAG: TerD family protein [Ruminococcus sp.]|nr:TerD family protein [Ruminococcus sp.]